MGPHIHPHAHVSNEDETGSSHPSASSAQVITPTRSKSRGFLLDLAGWPSYSDMRTQAPGDEGTSALHQPGNPARETPSGMAQLQKSSHLPTPQSPRYMPSYLLTGTSTPAQNLQPDPASMTLPTEFHSHFSPPPAPFRSNGIPTPEPSPLVARSRSTGSHSLSQIVHASGHHDDGYETPCKKRDTMRPRLSTPPGTPSRQTSTRPMTPVLQSRPPSPLEGGPISPIPTNFDTLRANHSATTLPLQRVNDEPGGEAARIRAQLIENHLNQEAESRWPDLKRSRRFSSSNDVSTGKVSLALASDLGTKDGSLLWSSANAGTVDSPIKGKRVALFQETSEESFEESLMAGGYGRYRSDRPSWKVDGNAEVQNQVGDTTGEAGLGSGLILTKEEKRKKTRLAAFLDPPRGPSTPQLFPVEIEGCGRVLIKLEPSEPQTPPKPTPKARRSRKRKKVSADMKQDLDKNSVTSPEDRTIDGPNWPDTEFPWRSRLATPDGLSIAEREKRLRYIESFLDRDSDEDDVEEHTTSGQPSPDGVHSRSPRLGLCKTYPLSSHSKHRERGLMTFSSDPADAKTALLSKKSIRAVHLRLLRRRNADQAAVGDEDEMLCLCLGPDDGRPLVQCDACRTWYHLECIGIQSTSELGKETDPWFCANCVDVRTPSPVAPLSEPTFAPTDDGEHGGLEGPDLFLNSGLYPSPTAHWTKTVRPPSTPPHLSSGSSWEEPPSSSSRMGPRTPQFNTASAFGDMVRVYSTTPGRSLEPLLSTAVDEPPFDPTSTPSRGIKFGLPFTTPKDGRWGSTSWQGVRGSGYELFHTPNRPGEVVILPARNESDSVAHGQVGEVPEEPLGTQSLYRMSGPNNVTPVERNAFGGPKRLLVLESPLGGKRSRRTVDS